MLNECCYYRFENCSEASRIVHLSPIPDRLVSSTLMFKATPVVGSVSNASAAARQPSYLVRGGCSEVRGDRAADSAWVAPLPAPREGT